MSFDLSKIPQREWTYQDEDDVGWQYGVQLHPNIGVTFWGEYRNDEDGGAYGMSFAKFLSTKDFRSTPPEIIEEIRQILRAARVKRK